MLVEDDTNLSEIYRARLEAEGYQIVSAGDGEAALAMAVKEKPDLIICDVMMPKISGFEMLDILRGTQGVQNTKVIMMTALSQAEDKARASALGADRYLVKSQVTLEDVVTAAKDVLAGSATSQPSPAAATPAPAQPPITPQVQATPVVAAPPATPAPAPVAASPPATAPTPATAPAPTPVIQLVDTPAETPATPVTPTAPAAAPVAETPDLTPAPEPALTLPEPTTTEPAAPPAAPATPTPPAETPAAPTPPTPAPTTPAPNPEPAAAPSETPPAINPDLAQTSASEESAVSQQIQDFIDQPTPNAPKDTANQAGTAPIPAFNLPTEEPPAAPAASAPPVPASPPEPSVPQAEPPDGVSIPGKKVIQPLNDIHGQPDFDLLLAKEAQKEVEQGAARPVVNGQPQSPPANGFLGNSTAQPGQANPNNGSGFTDPGSISL